MLHEWERFHIERNEVNTVVDYNKTAKEILDAVGGKNNVTSSVHCATRLRVELKNESLVNKSEIDQIKDVKGYTVSGTQHQFIIGTADVNNVYDAFRVLTGEKESYSDHNADETKASYRKMNPLSQAIKVISDIFVPIIPIVVAGGLLMCITAFLTTPGFISEQSIVEMFPGLSGVVGFLGFLSGIPFTYLPVLIGFTATKKFGGTPLLGATLGLVMVGGSLVNPANVAGADVPVWNMFGFQVAQIGYHSTVLPILAASWIVAKIENFGRKHIRNVMNLYVPFLSLVIASFITFLVIGPVLRSAGFLLTDGLVWLYDTTGMIGGALMGAIYAPLVVTGMHHSFIPIETQLIADIATTGGTFILPIAAMSNVAIGASSIGVAYINRKNKVLKSQAISAGITSIIGVSEPALFGINLKYKYAFFAALTGSAIASAFVATVQLKAISMGAGGLLGILCYRPSDLPVYLLAMAISIVCAFVLTNVYYYIYQKRSQSTL